jgi:hypothetical protein
MTMNAWRMCGYCRRQFLAYSSSSMGGEYLCPVHLRQMFAGFNPRQGDHVRTMDGPQTDWLVLAREGETLTVRPLGRPEVAAGSLQVAMCWPGFGSVTEAVRRGETIEEERGAS